MASDEITMNTVDVEDHHDALSFFDLQMDDEETVPDRVQFFESSAGDVFEFKTNSETKPDDHGIVFCGKSIVPPKQPIDDDTSDASGLFMKSQSSRAVASSDSFRFGGPKAVLPASGGGGGGGYSYGRSSSGSAASRKPLIIGLVRKWEQKMELSDMRKRQGRRAPAPMFRVTGWTGDGHVKSGSGGGNWGLLRQLVCGVHIGSALSKVASFGFISHA